MNIQTEHLDDHTARLTVEIETERLDKAKKQAARKLSKQVNIRGFRKGKVPYKILVNFIGEGPIIEEALESMGKDVYREALDESGVDPYGPGSLEDVDVESDPPVFTFTVPRQPTVELGDYRAVRLDYEPPVIEEEDVDRAMQHLREQYAEAEESDGPVATGHRVTLDIHSEFADDPPDDDPNRRKRARASSTNTTPRSSSTKTTNPPCPVSSPRWRGLRSAKNANSI